MGNRPASLADKAAEQARDTRARAWSYVFERYAEKQAGAGKQNAGGINAGDDTEGRSVDDFRAAKETLPQ